MSEDRRCELCGTLVDESDYQHDGYRHTDGRCTEYLKAALNAANGEAARLRAAIRRYIDDDDEDRSASFDAMAALVEPRTSSAKDNQEDSDT